jgi:hypothetical protein
MAAGDAARQNQGSWTCVPPADSSSQFFLAGFRGGGGASELRFCAAAEVQSCWVGFGGAMIDERFEI